MTKAFNDLDPKAVDMKTGLSGPRVADPTVKFEFRVTSFNVLCDFDGDSWKRRGATVVQILESNSADIIGI